MPNQTSPDRFFSGVSRRLFFSPFTPLVIVALAGAAAWARQAGVF